VKEGEKGKKEKTKLYINNTNPLFQKFVFQAGGEIVDWQQISSQLRDGIVAIGTRICCL
jgi:hypothetical protein